MIRSRKIRQYFVAPFALLAICASASPARAITFEAPMELSRWQVDASVFACKLYQPLNRYGEAVFMRRAGEPQRFYLHEQNRQFAEGEAQLLVQAPRWQGSAAQRRLGSVPVVSGAEPIRMDWQASQRLIGELQNGQQLLFSHHAWYADSTPVSVVLEPIRFRLAFTEFQQCLGGLLPVNYDQINRSSVVFTGGMSEFEPDQQPLLDNVIQYVLADQHVTTVVIDGHTDGQGLRADNLELSKQRAEFVAAYLKTRGVAEDLIQVRWHGERYPVASNRSAAGRAENRRVTLRIDRFEPKEQSLEARGDNISPSSNDPAAAETQS
ncbi:flagellar protein MotY [Gilvimarinus polysaccharolyticus]|uniref:flagellar protein MotY n=1 Tax=Gilvimarinus polysaccharolyticus TaxID=863921 RepID=UPI0018DCC8F9|nr:OmpA family protein [Gilvimarinus polysaccharolyticus]